MSDESIKAFLANGGVIQQIKPGVSGIPEGSTFSAWGAPRKAGRPAATETPAQVVDDADETEDKETK